MKLTSKDKRRFFNTLAIIICLILLWLFTSCKANTVYVPVKESETIIEIIKDTIIDIQLVPYKDSVVVNDTISYLENKYAYSWSKWSNGRLFHSLGILNIKHPVEIKYLDREVIKEIEKPYPVKGDTIYINELKWWQEGSVWFTGVAIISLILYFGIRYRRKIINFILKLM